MFTECDRFWGFGHSEKDVEAGARQAIMQKVGREGKSRWQTAFGLWMFAVTALRQSSLTNALYNLLYHKYHEIHLIIQN